MTPTPFTSFVTIREAGTAPDGAARVVIITEGLGNLRDRNYYTREAVESCVPLFNGKQFFIDHPTATEEGDRPERSVRDLAGYFYDTARGTVKDPVTGDTLVACLGSLRFDESDAGQIARAKVATALEYQRRFPNSKSVYAGISINGGGVSEPGMIQGMQVNLVKEIQEAVSADIVTRPARGGRFVNLMQEAERMAEWRTQHARHRASNTVRTEPSGGKGMAEAKGSAAAVVRTPIRDTTPKREAVVPPMEAPATIKDAVAKIQKMLTKLPPDPDGVLALISDLKSDTELLAGMLSQTGGAPAIATGEAIGPDAMPLDPPALPAEEPVAPEDAMALGGSTHSIDDEEAAVMTGDATPVADATAGVVGGEDSEETEESKETDADAGMGKETAITAETETEMAEAETAMRYACAHCGESNDVLPPKGHKLVNTSESDRAQEDAARVLAQTVARLQREIARKEGRFVEANKDKGNLLNENIRLKAELSGFKRRDSATKMLREAEIPSDVLSVEDLLQLEPASWPVQIKQAKRTITREAAVLNAGGAGPRGDGAPQGVDASVNLAVAAFKESYR